MIKRMMMRSIAVAVFLSATGGVFPQEVRLNELKALLQGHPDNDAGRLRLLIAAADACSHVQADTTILLAQEALDLANKLNNRPARATALALRGRGELLAGRMPEARSDLRQAFDQATLLRDDAGRITASKGLAAMAILEGWNEKAAREVDQAITLAASDTAAMIELYITKGMGQYNTGMPDQALGTLDKAVSMASLEATPSLLAWALASRAFPQSMLGHQAEARNDLDSAMVLSRAMGDRYGLVLAFSNEGVLHWAASDMPGALRSFLSSLEWAERLNDKNNASGALGNIGKVHAVLGEYAQAKDYAERSVVMARTHGSGWTLMNSLSDIGYDARGLGDREICFAAYTELLHVADSLNSWAYVNEADISLAESYIVFGQPDQSVRHGLRGVAGADTLGDPMTLARAHMALGNALLAAGDAALLQAGIDPDERAERAIEQYHGALANSQEMDAIKYEAFLGISRAHEQAGRFDLALRFHQSAAAARDSFLTQEKNQAVADLQIQYETKKKEQQIVLLGKEKEVQAKEIQKQKIVRNGFMGGFALVALFAGVFFVQRNRISKARKRSDELLLNILPGEVAEELKDTGAAAAKHFDNATILFTDFKGFTQASERMSPQELVEELNTCFKAFDNIITAHGIEKIKTIGDAYMCAGGLPDPKSSSPADVVQAALEMQAFMKRRKAERDAQSRPAFEMRVGIHTGPVVAGIVGVKKFQYDIWGDTVNTANRMESSGEVGRVNISETTYSLVKDARKVNGEWSIVNGGSTHSPTPDHHSPATAQSPFTNSHSPTFVFTPRGKVQAKGKGEMEMYFVQRSS